MITFFTFYLVVRRVERVLYLLFPERIDPPTEFNHEDGRESESDAQQLGPVVSLVIVAVLPLMQVRMAAAFPL